MEKVVIVGESYHAGVRGHRLQPPEANGGLGAEPPNAEMIFQYFPKK